MKPVKPKQSQERSGFDGRLDRLLNQGWRITADGPTGCMLEGPKSMRIMDRAALVAGAIVLIVHWPSGLGLIAMALIDFALLTKPQTRFVRRADLGD